MKKNITVAYLLAIFPLTGLLGVHQLYLLNFKRFFIRLISWLTVIGVLIFWIYDLINLPKMVNQHNKTRENQVNVIINLLDQGKLKEALKMFVKTGYTQVYVREIIKRGKGDVIVKHFAATEKDKKDLERLISNGDTESLVVYLTSYYAKSKMTGLLAS
ncbi:NINE protein [Aestuariibaculum lutulentum]|uniref:TM2 domain-containing protein n=1 Tax=Aestuariibaculum lutulentum TaxID=2920935 RepID=A0ABS9RIK2_9FLAO|nr:TM2 domain-containing protein [Aestuariibaculum lutulentum]MCH4552768.1 TM2 domain-containing protein [Aestuariibaculum lutulentum]